MNNTADKVKVDIEERMRRAMEQNKTYDEIALKTLGFKSLEEFIKAC